MIIHERLVELTDFCAALKSNASVSQDLAAIEPQLRQLADRVAPFTGKGTQSASLPL
jgi:hypothetical protein